MTRVSVLDAGLPQDGAPALSPAEIMAPDDWEWESDWKIDATGSNDASGWEYAEDFGNFSTKAGEAEFITQSARRALATMAVGYDAQRRVSGFRQTGLLRIQFCFNKAQAQQLHLDVQAQYVVNEGQSNL